MEVNVGGRVKPNCGSPGQKSNIILHVTYFERITEFDVL